MQFNHLDSSLFSLTGEYLPDSDEHAVMITQGHSKDHRPDLKQAVTELMVSRDGGVPTLYKCRDGNASDNTIFKERSQELIQQFKAGGDDPGPAVLVYAIAQRRMRHELKRLGTALPNQIGKPVQNPTLR